VSNALAVLAVGRGAWRRLADRRPCACELENCRDAARVAAFAIDRGEALLIDESYNANPTSMAASLALLGEKTARRGGCGARTMRELGEQSDVFHAALVDPIVAAGVDYPLLVETVGPLA